MPKIVGVFAPVTLGTLPGFPQIVSFAKRAKRIASFAAEGIPYLSVGFTETPPDAAAKLSIIYRFSVPPPLTMISSRTISDDPKFLSAARIERTVNSLAVVILSSLLRFRPSDSAKNFSQNSDPNSSRPVDLGGCFLK